MANGGKLHTKGINSMIWENWGWWAKDPTPTQPQPDDFLSARVFHFIDNKVCRHLARRTGLGGLDSSYTNEHNKSIIHANGTILARAITGYKNLPSQLFQMLWEMISVRTWATVSKKKIQYCPVSGLAPSLTYDYPGSWCDGLIEWK